MLLLSTTRLLPQCIQQHAADTDAPPGADESCSCSQTEVHGRTTTQTTDQKRNRALSEACCAGRAGENGEARTARHMQRPLPQSSRGASSPPPFGVLSQTFRATARLMYRLRSSPVVRPARSYLYSPARDTDTQGEGQATWRHSQNIRRQMVTGHCVKQGQGTRWYSQTLSGHV